MDHIKPIGEPCLLLCRPPEIRRGRVEMQVRRHTELRLDGLDLVRFVSIWLSHEVVLYSWMADNEVSLTVLTIFSDSGVIDMHSCIRVGHH